MHLEPHWWQLFLIVNIILMVMCTPEIKDDFKGAAYHFRWCAMILGTLIFWFLYLIIGASFRFS